MSALLAVLHVREKACGVKWHLKTSLGVFKHLEPQETVRKRTGKCWKPQNDKYPQDEERAKEKIAKAPLLPDLITVLPAHLWDMGCQGDERRLRLGKMLRYGWTYSHVNLQEYLLLRAAPPSP